MKKITPFWNWFQKKRTRNFQCLSSQHQEGGNYRANVEKTGLCLKEYWLCS